MAIEDDLDLDVEGAAKPAKSKMLIIVLIVVLLLGISTAVTLVLTGVLSGDKAVTAVADAGADSESADKAKAKAGKDDAAQKAPLNYVPLDPPFVVNFSADSEIRFLQISVEAGTRDPAVVDQVKEHRPAIRNSLVLLFSSQNPYELNDREGKEKLRANTLAEIQKVLKEETGSSGVENVFFTSFVMQ